jgi:putative phosphoesterase
VLEELEALAPVAAVHGNVDEPALVATLPARRVVEAEGLRLGVVHSGGMRAGRHERLRSWFPDCDAVAYGHSHQPEVDRSDGVWILNPGSAADRRREPTHTMIVIREGVPKLVDLGP